MKFFSLTSKVAIIFVFLLIFNNIVAQLPTKPPKQIPPLSRILFIFDASQSMNGTWEKNKKINIARNVLIAMLDSLEKLDNIEIALRMYGHQKPVPPQDCSDSKLEVPFGKGNASKIRQKLRFVDPKGTTPIANSLAMSAKDFPKLDNCRNIIILITDGIEACDGDPCAVSRELQKQGITLKPFIIGIGIDEGFKQSFDCIGQYYNANKEEKFKEVLNVVISQALNSTTAQINLLDNAGKPTETNVNMSFYDYYSGKLKYNYMHTMNHRGNPDTLVLDPLVTYRLTVHTIPAINKDSFKLIAGKHAVIALDAPQGYLNIKSDNGAQARNLLCIIRKAGDMNTLNYQEVNRIDKYITGKYDIEIPVLPKMLLYNVDITQSTTTTVQIPSAGLVTFLMTAPGYGSLYLRENDKDLKWIYNLNTSVKNESLYLQAGSYTVVYRALNAKQTLYTINKTFEVSPRSSQVIDLN
jgi:Ca-activated chloride channel family protein